MLFLGSEYFKGFMRPGFVFLMNAMFLSFLVIIYLFGLAYDLCGLVFFNDNSSDVLMD